MKHTHLFLIVFLLLISCVDTRIGILENAQQLFNEGEFEDALSEIALVKSSKEDSISQKIVELQNMIKDTIAKIDYASTYDGMKVNRNDSAIFGFQLHSTKSQVMNCLNSLQRKNIIEGWNTYNFTINGLGGYTQDLELSGYQLDFFPSDYKCTGLMKFEYFQGRLISIEISLFRFPDGINSEKVYADCKSMYENKYGLPKDKVKYYTSEELKYIKCFFREKNKAVYLNEALGFVVIKYEDIVAKVDRDSIKNEVRKIDKKIKKNKSKDMQI